VLTLTVPVVPAAGAFTTSVVAVALVTFVATPLNLTVLSAGVVLKLVPVMVTVVPAIPDAGLIAEMAGSIRRTGFFLQPAANSKHIIAAKDVTKLLCFIFQAYFIAFTKPTLRLFLLKDRIAELQNKSLNNIICFMTYI